LPQQTQEIVRTALALSVPDNPYLFPQLRLRRAEDAGNGHLSERLLNRALAELQTTGRSLHSAQNFSTHAFRSTFTTHMGKEGFTTAEKKLVLDHVEGRKNDVTERHYDLEQSLSVKFAMLSRWETIIDGTSAKTINLVSAV
jgi:integrase